jgi:hypothetical protein
MVWMSIKTFFKSRKFAFWAVLTILALMLVDTVVTSGLSTRKSLEVTYEGYALFESTIAIVIIVSAVVLLFLNRSYWLRVLLIAYNSLLTFALLTDVVSLMIALPRQTEGYAILLDAFLIWLTNLFIFALWYWLLDGGGSERRNRNDKKPHYDLMFPQEQQVIPGWENWRPNFLDYTFLPFYSSMAFTPTDTLILSRKMKFLLMIQAAISVVVLAMIGARAINLLG